MSDSPAKLTRRQYSLRTLLVMISIVAILFALIREFGVATLLAFGIILVSVLIQGVVILVFLALISLVVYVIVIM